MTDDEFSFASLVQPGQASRQAMERELKLRKEKDDQVYRWEPGYVYTGTADYLLKHGQWFAGRKLPEQWTHVRGESNKCYFNALEACQQERSLRYFTGVYLAGTRVQGHAWCVDGEGGVVEVTFTTDPEEEGRRAWLSDRRGGAVPYLAPERWAYCGVEFDVDWAARWIEAHGELGCILDPRGTGETVPWETRQEQKDDIFRHLYSKTGAPL